MFTSKTNFDKIATNSSSRSPEEEVFQSQSTSFPVNFVIYKAALHHSFLSFHLAVHLSTVHKGFICLTQTEFHYCNIKFCLFTFLLTFLLTLQRENAGVPYNMLLHFRDGNLL
ncbi:hypothetical protein CDL12_02240 [Handroanthus impetiginosus]|uniref:Uncharacterized protein n=1 Tax=Handroanthus impetiginosus TaxID=429701 RepID=A0A2G9I5J0_9LAMI|nr:hypothetical protein CDL12_02240 [Handroanthus impetiginosus]